MTLRGHRVVIMTPRGHRVVNERNHENTAKRGLELHLNAEAKIGIMLIEEHAVHASAVVSVCTDQNTTSVPHFREDAKLCSMCALIATV